MKLNVNMHVLLPCVIVTSMICLLGYLIYQGGFSPEAQARAAAVKARDEANKIPHVISEADGCRVYAFTAAGSWHYFTRCPNSYTTTERHYQECHLSGKANHCEDKSETL